MESDLAHLFANTDNQSASVIQIESSKLLPWLAVCAIISSLALGITIANNIAQNRIEAAREQTINDIRNRAIDAETQALLLREHYDRIANDFAAKGYKLPDLPSSIKPAK